MTISPRRVLVVEDEVMLAMLIEDMLHDAGHEVVGPAMHLDEALSFARDAQVDIAVLDVNLNGKASFPVAEVLRGRGIPFVFATGYGAGGIDPEHVGAVTLSKPFSTADLEKAFAEAFSQA